MKMLRMLIGNFFCFVVPGVTLIVAIVYTVSPIAFSRFATWADDPIQVPASIDSCTLVRDGTKRQHAIRCVAHYTYEDAAFASPVTVWTSQSPFATPASLDQELQAQRSVKTRTVELFYRDKSIAGTPDERWLATPGLGAFLVAALAGVLAYALYRQPRTSVHRRADYVLDPTTDELVPINDRARKAARPHWRLWTAIILLAMLVCLYGVSDRLSKEVSLLGFASLESVPATLVDCEHRYYGTRKGHNQINCGFRYAWQGQTYRGQAESLDFRFFPTDARMDAEVARKQGTPVQARVDPKHPDYAWAFIDAAWVLPYTWGPLELLLLGLLVGVLPIALVMRRRRSD